jgi:hypothetical protein
MKYLKCIVIIVFFSCNNTGVKTVSVEKKSDSSASCMMVPLRFADVPSDSVLKFNFCYRNGIY